jgi:hypothetical protein
MHLLKETGIYTGLIGDKQDVDIETAGLSATDPSRRPADVSVILRPELRTPFSTLAIDLTAVGLPPLVDTLTQQKTLHLQNHQRAEATKWTGATPTIVPDLLDKRTVVLPFSIGLHGDLGYCATSFLFGRPPPDKRPTYSSLLIPSSRPPECAEMMSLATTRTPDGILGTASQTWRRLYDTKWFGTNYKETTPLTWAVSFLANNYAEHISVHFLRSMKKVAAPSYHRSPQKSRPSRVFGASSRWRGPTTSRPAQASDASVLFALGWDSVPLGPRDRSLLDSATRPLHNLDRQTLTGTS